MISFYFVSVIYQLSNLFQIEVIRRRHLAHSPERLPDHLPGHLSVPSHLLAQQGILGLQSRHLPGVLHLHAGHLCGVLHFDARHLTSMLPFHAHHLTSVLHLHARHQLLLLPSPSHLPLSRKQPPQPPNQSMTEAPFRAKTYVQSIVRIHSLHDGIRGW